MDSIVRRVRCGQSLQRQRFGCRFFPLLTLVLTVGQKNDDVILMYVRGRGKDNI